MRGSARFSFSSMTDEESDENVAFSSMGLCWVRGVLGRYPSGQRGQTVNLLPSASKVRILACPPNAGKFLVASAEGRAAEPTVLPPGFSI